MIFVCFFKDLSITQIHRNQQIQITTNFQIINTILQQTSETIIKTKADTMAITTTQPIVRFQVSIILYLVRFILKKCI